MSKGIIVSHIAHALYVVKVQLDTSALEARIETIDRLIEELNISISGELQDAIDAKKAELAAIPIPDGEIDEKTLDDVIRRVVAARREVDKAQAAQDQAKARRESLVDEKGKLGREEKETTLELWCADYTRTLKEGDEVGLIDWFLYRSGSTVGNPVIVPATSTGKAAKYDPQRDGNRVPVVGMSVNSWWYAMCSAAGVEREMPLYRKATVLAINDDGTLNVEVDSVYTDISIDEKPLENSKVMLSNVPAKYMSCDAAVFKVDDRVIVEYPPKDIHADLQRLFSDKAAGYTDLAQKQDEKIAVIDADIAEKDVLIESYQVQVDLIMADIDAATQGAGIDDLRAEIEATETALTDLASTLSTLRGELDTAETNAAGLRQQIAEKQQQILDKQAQIDAAPPEQDVSGLQTDINILLGEIWLLNIDLTYDESTIADKRNAIKTAEEDRANAQDYIASLRDQIVSLGASIEYLRLALQQELELQNAVQAEKTKLLDEKYQLEAYKAGLEQQAYRLNIDATAQASKSLAMKVLIEKKPKVATVIGFVDHPRPCYAIAYKDQNAAWRIINAYPLSTSPEVIGDFNLGLQDPETGFYDCACVWSKDAIPRLPKIRHDGVTYPLSAPHNNDIILSAGVRRVDSDYEIVVVTTTSARVDISVITLSISNGEITDIDSKVLSLNDSFYSDTQLLTARVSGDAEFFAAVGMNGGNIYTVDTRTLAVLIAHEVQENPPPVVADNYWQEGIIAYPTDAGGKLGHTGSTQQTDYQMIVNKPLFRPTLDGGIFFVAMTDSVSYNDTHSWFWEWLPSGFSGGIVDENGTLTTASAVVNQ